MITLYINRTTVFSPKQVKSHHEKYYRNNVLISSMIDSPNTVFQTQLVILKLSLI